LPIYRVYGELIKTYYTDVSDEMEKVDMNSKAFNELDFEYNWLAGQIIATRHLLSVANDILSKTKEN